MLDPELEQATSLSFPSLLEMERLAVERSALER